MNDNCVWPIKKKDTSHVDMRVIYQKLMVAYLAILIIGYIFQIYPPFHIILAISVLSVFFSRKKIDVDYIRQYLFIILFSMYGIIVATFTGGGYGGPITIITGLMVCYAIESMKFDKHDVYLIVICCIMSIIYWIIRSPGYYDEFFYNQWKGDGTLTNANGVGYILCYQGSFLFIILSLSKKKVLKKLKWVIGFLCLFGCYNVRARMAIISLAFFLGCSLLIQLFPPKRIRFIKIILILSVLLEIIFPFIYVILYKSGFGSSIVFFGLSEKGLYSGREAIWIKAFDAIQSLPDLLFGIGSHQDFWKDKTLNMHNNAMNLLVVVGLVGMCVYYVYLIRYIFRKFDFKNASMLQWQCMVFFVGVVIAGATDITLFYNQFLAYYFIPLGISLNSNYKGFKTAL